MKTIAEIFFLTSSYIDWRKITEKLACQGHRAR